MDTGVKRAVCPHCHTEFTYYQRHAGFGEEGYIYCDQDEVVLTWGMFDPKYRDITQKPPWTLAHDEGSLVEKALKPCPFGGRFAFGNPPLCPTCFKDISTVVPGGIYYVVTGRRIDGDQEEVWA